MLGECHRVLSYNCSFFMVLCSFFLPQVNAQCIPSFVANVENPVCSDANTSTYSTGVIKIPITSIAVGNTYTFTTVTETSGDTFLALYDNDNNLLISNDDDPDCNCKQSTLIYTNDGGANFNNAYVVLSKPGCASIDFTVSLQFNVRNDYNSDPYVTSPVNLLDKCVGATVQFTAANTSSDTVEIWESLTPDLLSIDKKTGLSVILKGGLGKILVKGKSSCDVKKTYLIKVPVTSVIKIN